MLRAQPLIWIALIANEKRMCDWVDFEITSSRRALDSIKRAVLGVASGAARPGTYLRDYHMTPPCRTEVPGLVGRNVDTQHPGIKTAELNYVAGLKGHDEKSCVVLLGSQRKSFLGQTVPCDVIRSVHFIMFPTLKPEYPSLPKRHGQVQGNVVLVVAHDAEELKLELEQCLPFKRRDETRLWENNVISVQGNRKRRRTFGSPGINEFT